jgi:hypothetical protein
VRPRKRFWEESGSSRHDTGTSGAGEGCFPHTPGRKLCLHHCGKPEVSRRSHFPLCCFEIAGKRELRSGQILQNFQDHGSGREGSHGACLRSCGGGIRGGFTGVLEENLHSDDRATFLLRLAVGGRAYCSFALRCLTFHFPGTPVPL